MGLTARLGLGGLVLGATLLLAGCSDDGIEVGGIQIGGGQDDPAQITGIPVIWRLDDIQAFYCSDTFEPIVQTFIRTQTPLTLGIIGRDLEQDPEMVAHLQELQADHPDLISFANHSYNHSLSGMPSYGSAEAQAAEIEQGQQVIQDVLGVQAQTFIPPGNAFDDNTIKALDSLGMTTISSECTWNPSDQPIDCPTGNNSEYPGAMTYQGITTAPAGSVIDDFQAFDAPASVATAMRWSDAQIKNQGFSVIMVHPQELSDDPSCQTIDQSKIDVITSVISQGEAKGWSFTDFEELTAQAQDSDQETDPDQEEEQE